LQQRKLVSIASENAGIWSVVNSLIYDYKIDKELIFKGLEQTDLNTISAVDLILIANNLNVDAENLFTGKIHREEVVKQLSSGHNCTKPNHFMEKAYSSTTSLSSLLNKAEKFGKKDYLLKKLQVNENYLDDHKPISVLACRDALNAMNGLFGLKEITEIGKQNAQKFCAGNFGAAMVGTTKQNAAIDSFVENSHLIEKNWNYKIVRTGNKQVILESVETQEMLEHLQGEVFSTIELNTWRWSFLEEVIQTFSNKHVTCKQVSSIGDKGKVVVQIEYQ
jgi:hypothetical protein